MRRIGHPLVSDSYAHMALALDEATELASAWAGSLSESLGIRVLLIKGRALQVHGLRSEHVSSDVDVLVEPARFLDFCEAIEAHGWRRRPEAFLDSKVIVHSRAYVHEGWCCDLDVHSNYPGFLAQPAHVFDTLWARRIRLSFAHRDVWVPDRVSSALLLALHSLRGNDEQHRHKAELEFLLRVEFSTRERSEIAALAHAVRCNTTLADVLPQMGVTWSSPRTWCSGR